MSDAPYLKCRCQHCGGSIEFPAAGLGVVTQCPHCGERTTLFNAETESIAVRPDPAPYTSELTNLSPSEIGPAKTREGDRETMRRGTRWTLRLLFILAIAGAGSGAFYYRKHRRAAQTALVIVPLPLKTNEVIPVVAEPAPAPPPTPTVPKSMADLKVGPITLEKAKSGSLVYAVGILKNNSDYARYGVKIELDLSDAKNTRASKATDYIQVLEPHQEWRFRALILDAKAVSAKLAKVTEDE